MGRRPDAAATQEAKGDPGRRKSARAGRAEEAKRVAELLAAPATGGAAAMPSLFASSKLFEAARAVWNELAPRLTSTYRLEHEDRLIFAMLCVNIADWVRLNQQLLTEGETQVVNTVAGDPMTRVHPAARRRQEAFSNVLELSKRFGLTPTDRFTLFKDQGYVAQLQPWLFGGKPSAPVSEDQGENQQPPDPLRAGMLREMDSPPPGTRPN